MEVMNRSKIGYTVTFFGCRLWHSCQPVDLIRSADPPASFFVCLCHFLFAFNASTRYAISVFGDPARAVSCDNRCSTVARAAECNQNRTWRASRRSHQQVPLRHAEACLGLSKIGYPEWKRTDWACRSRSLQKHDGASA